jgi:serine/threonine protein kinase
VTEPSAPKGKVPAEAQDKDKVRSPVPDWDKAEQAVASIATALVNKQVFRADGVTLEGRFGTKIGSYSCLMRGQLGPSTAVVVKVFLGERSSLECFDKEKSVMDRLGRSHANIMTYHKAIAGALPAIVYPLMQGSMDQVVQAGALTRRDMKIYGGQVASALRHMHQQRVAHFDLKATNILVDYDGTAKLGGFGSAIFVGSTEVVALSATHGALGSVCYKAPEVLEAREGDRIKPFKNDVYGFGILLWELHARQRAYAHLASTHDDAQIRDEVRDGGRPQPISAGWSDTIVGLMLACWHNSPDARPPMERVCSVLGV